MRLQWYGGGIPGLCQEASGLMPWDFPLMLLRAVLLLRSLTASGSVSAFLSDKVYSQLAFKTPELIHPPKP